MKHIFLTLLIFLLFFSWLVPAFAASPVEAKDVSIMLDCRKMETGQPPIITGERTLLPLRSLLLGLGVPNDDEHIIWNQKDKSVTIIKDDSRVYLKIGSRKALVNENEVMLDVSPVLYKNGSTYIPVRFVSQALGMKVAWDPLTKTVLIRNEGDFNKTRDLLGGLSLSMENIGKVRMETILNMAFTDKKSNFLTKAEMSFSLDRDNAIMSTFINVPLFSKIMNFKTYYTNSARYEYDPASAKWRKYAFTEAEFTETASKNINPFASLPEDISGAGFSITGDGEPGEIKITGVVFPDALSRLIPEKMQIGKYTVNSCLSEIYVDEASLAIKRITMNIKGKVKGISGSSDMTANIGTVYTYPDESFSIELPKGLPN